MQFCIFFQHVSHVSHTALSDFSPSSCSWHLEVPHRRSSHASLVAYGRMMNDVLPSQTTNGGFMVVLWWFYGGAEIRCNHEIEWNREIPPACFRVHFITALSIEMHWGIFEAASKHIAALLGCWAPMHAQIARDVVTPSLSYLSSKSSTRIEVRLNLHHIIPNKCSA